MFKHIIFYVQVFHQNGRYNDAKYFLTQCPGWQINHDRCKANMVAHKLAKLALFQNEKKVWSDEYSSYVCVTH
jgi:hypothetical protein